MTTTTAPAPLPTVPPEVTAFAAEAGVTAYLPAVLAMTRRLFPAAPLTVQLDIDPEIPDDRHIIVLVDVSGMSVDQMSHLQQEWIRQIFDICPAPHVCVFRIGLV